METKQTIKNNLRKAGWLLGFFLLSAALVMILLGKRLEQKVHPDPNAARRFVNLDGAHNFRDLGGYKTVDGRTVRWGKLYRSDHLAELTPDDLDKLEKLKLKLVCDFRSREERKQSPDRLPETDPPAVVMLEINASQFNRGRLKKKFLSGDIDFNFPEMLKTFNRSFVTMYTPQYKAMFQKLSSSANLPVLIHCTAGKDRAGFGSAIILTALGVPEETVFEDYLLSNFHRAGEIEKILWRIRIGSLFRTDTEKIRPLFIAHHSYLQTAFDEIKKHYGSFDKYLEQGLGVNHAQLEALRNKLLD